MDESDTQQPQTAVGEWECRFCGSRRQSSLCDACVSCGAPQLEARILERNAWEHPYSAESARAFTWAFLAGVCCFAAFGYLHMSGVRSAHWALLLAPLVGGTWFGASGHWLPVDKLLVGGVMTGLAGVIWLVWPDWSRMTWPSHPYLSLGILAVGVCSFVLGRTFGGLARRYCAG